MYKGFEKREYLFLEFLHALVFLFDDKLFG
jgi:hypothetical protein